LRDDRVQLLSDVRGQIALTDVMILTLLFVLLAPERIHFILVAVRCA
jgi:hypothetical protein